MSAAPLLSRLGALRDEFAACAKVAAADNNNEAAMAFAAARDRLDETVASYVAKDKAAFFNPTLASSPSCEGHPIMNASNTAHHGPN